MKITELQTDKLIKGEKFEREDLLKLYEIGAIVKTIEIPSIGEYKDYEFIIDENYEVIIGEKLIGEKPKISLLKDTEELVEKLQIMVNVTTNEGTIEMVKKPDGNTTNETNFIYEITENKIYTFIAKGSNGRYAVETIEITNIKETAKKPIIETNYGYPILTETSIELDKNVTITYDEKVGLEHYYSLDNGLTWNKYNGTFNIENPQIIMAKTEKNGKILSESSKEISIPDNALAEVAYDGNEGIFNGFTTDNTTATYWTGIKRINVDTSSTPMQLEIFYTRHPYASLDFKCYNNEGKELSTITLNELMGAIGKQTISVPKNTAYIEINMSHWATTSTVASNGIYEIKPTVQEPIIEGSNGYPIIKRTKIEIEKTLVTIKYDAKPGLEHYYSLDNGNTWNIYKQPFEIQEPQTIKAKTEKNGKILSQTSKEITMPDDALAKVAYDGNEGTFNGFTTDNNTATYWTGIKRINVDTSSTPMQLEIFYTRHPYGSLDFKYYNNAGNELKSITLNDIMGTIGKQTIDIPENTAYIEINMSHWATTSTVASNGIYEIKPK